MFRNPEQGEQQKVDLITQDMIKKKVVCALKKYKMRFSSQRKDVITVLFFVFAVKDERGVTIPQALGQVILS